MMTTWNKKLAFKKLLKETLRFFCCFLFTRQLLWTTLVCSAFPSSLFFFFFGREIRTVVIRGRRRKEEGGGWGDVKARPWSVAGSVGRIEAYSGVKSMAESRARKNRAREMRWVSFSIAGRPAIKSCIRCRVVKFYDLFSSLSFSLRSSGAFAPTISTCFLREKRNLTYRSTETKMDCFARSSNLSNWKESNLRFRSEELDSEERRESISS